MSEKISSGDFEYGSDNVFKDLETPVDDIGKLFLAIEICKILKKRNLSQIQAAKTLGVDQSKVSLILTGKLHYFSYERLFKFLNKLGQDIIIKVRPNLYFELQGTLEVISSEDESTKEKHE